MMILSLSANSMIMTSDHEGAKAQRQKGCHVKCIPWIGAVPEAGLVVLKESTAAVSVAGAGSPVPEAACSLGGPPEAAAPAASPLHSCDTPTPCITCLLSPQTCGLCYNV